MFGYKNPVVARDMEQFSSLSIEAYAGKRILITGLTGMLATYLAYVFLYWNDSRGADIRVVGLVRNREKAEKRFFDLLGREDFSLLVQDITEPIKDSLGFDYIFHLAGSASAAAILSSPQGIITANVLGTKNVLELAAQKPGSRVFFASTREVYGKTDAEILDESCVGLLDPLSPRSCYPESKRMAENLCAVYSDRFGVKTAVGRIAHSYGPGMQLKNDGRIMADLICNAVERTDITLKSDGSALRAFCYITDAVAAVLMATAQVSGLEVYNIANEREEISVRGLAFMVAELVEGLKVVFTTQSDAEKKAYFNVPRVSLSTKKIEALGWAPRVGLKEGVSRTVEAMSK